MGRAFKYAFVAVLIYVVPAELLVMWYESSLASAQPGFGVLIGGALGFLLFFPGAVVLEALGLYTGSGVTAQRQLEAQMAIGTTALLLYVLVFGVLLLVLRRR